MGRLRKELAEMTDQYLETLSDAGKWAHEVDVQAAQIAALKAELAEYKQAQQDRMDALNEQSERESQEVKP